MTSQSWAVGDCISQYGTEWPIMKIWHSRHNSAIKFLAGEMLEISQAVSRDFAPNASATETELVLLPVDPHHLYAYWNLAADAGAGIREAGGERALTLRIYWRPEKHASIAHSKLWFDVQIEGTQTHSKIQLPIDDTFYSAALGIRSPDRRFTSLAESNTIHVPRARIAPDVQASDPGRPKPGVHQQGAEVALGLPSTSEIYDEVIIDAIITKTLFQKRLDRKVAVLLNHEPDQVERGTDYDEVSVDFEIRKTLYEKGVEVIVDLLAGSENELNEKSSLARKTASGRGILR